MAYILRFVNNESDVDGDEFNHDLDKIYDSGENWMKLVIICMTLVLLKFCAGSVIRFWSHWFDVISRDLVIAIFKNQFSLFK